MCLEVNDHPSESSCGEHKPDVVVTAASTPVEKYETYDDADLEGNTLVDESSSTPEFNDPLKGTFNAIGGKSAKDSLIHAY